MWVRKFRDEKGFAIVLLAGGLLVLICVFAGLAIDVARAYVAKAELQNAADAAALAGVQKLYPCSPANIPAWNNAEAAATTFARANKVDGANLAASAPQVAEAGYWNYATATFTPRTGVQGAGDVLAVRVTLAKSSASGNGAVPALFAKVAGWNSFEPGASAVAARSPDPTPVFPLVISGCLVEDAKNVTGPVNLVLTAPYLYQGVSGIGGQWSSLTGSGGQGASLLKGYVAYLTDPADKQATPPPVPNLGDTVTLESSGQMNSVYQQTESLINSGKTRVRVPFGDCPIPTGSPSAIVRGFVPVELKVANTTSLTITGRLYPVQLAK
jgi:Flp pilus assembly protein TadG